MVISVGSLFLTFSSLFTIQLQQLQCKQYCAVGENGIFVFFLLRVLNINCCQVKYDNNSCLFVFHMPRSTVAPIFIFDISPCLIHAFFFILTSNRMCLCNHYFQKQITCFIFSFIGQINYCST